jgi:hypothetical protein
MTERTNRASVRPSYDYVIVGAEAYRDLRRASYVSQATAACS